MFVLVCEKTTDLSASKVKSRVDMRDLHKLRFYECNLFFPYEKKPPEKNFTSPLSLCKTLH